MATESTTPQFLAPIATAVIAVVKFGAADVSGGPALCSAVEPVR